MIAGERTLDDLSRDELLRLVERQERTIDVLLNRKQPELQEEPFRMRNVVLQSNLEFLVTEAWLTVERLRAEGRFDVSDSLRDAVVDVEKVLRA